MKFTGERPVTGDPNAILRYKMAMSFCKGKKVLDMGTGLGDGARMLSEVAYWVTGVDKQEVIEEAQKLGTPDNVYWQCERPNKSYDIVVALEFLEHLEPEDLDWHMLNWKDIPEIVATWPNGNRFPYHPMTKAQRVGFHTWHYTWDETYEVFGRYYDHVVVFGWAWDPKHSAWMSFGVYANGHKKLMGE